MADDTLEKLHKSVNRSTILFDETSTRATATALRALIQEVISLKAEVAALRQSAELA